MVSAIILAAGSGKRMNNARPKQYLDLAGLPVLSRTLMVFDDHPAVNRIFVVVAAEEIPYCRKHILSTVAWKTEIMLVPGGEHRQDSVYEGIKAAERQTGDHAIVLIHDGVRPFVSGDMITDCIDCAAKSGACILGVPASDTLKQADSRGLITGTISRKNVWMAQTPQAFSLKRIKAGLENAIEKGLLVTDDASVLESYGTPVQILPGSKNNIKITTPEDLHFALFLLGEAGKS